MDIREATEAERDEIGRVTAEAYPGLVRDESYLARIAARSRMLQAWGVLEHPSPEADWWVAKAGPEHYAEHLPRLRAWVAELGAGRG